MSFTILKIVNDCKTKLNTFSMCSKWVGQVQRNVHNFLSTHVFYYLTVYLDDCRTQLKTVGMCKRVGQVQRNGGQGETYSSLV